MRFHRTSSRARAIEISWSETDWKPQVRLRIAGLKLAAQSPEKRLAPPLPFSNSMRNIMITNHLRPRAFTLVELLVVIGIIALLAGMIIPVVGNVRTKAKVAKAKVEIGMIANAVKQYESEYTRPPASPAAEQDAAAKMENPTTKDQADYTFGYSGKLPNSEVMAILLGQDAASNTGHKRNPRRLVLLNAKQSPSVNAPGISTTDWVYRDPWDSPYIITVDLNFDDKCYDAYYGDVPQPVAVWSMGPDKQVQPTYNPSKPAEGYNKDNILSWK